MTLHRKTIGGARRLLFALICWRLICAGLLAADPTGIIPLKDIRPGMKGVWKSVVSGTEIRSFDLEVLGVVENFVGPQRDMLICQATGEEMLRDGPVSGMSGSPVYIDGKLAGAYAFGFTWAKEQTLVGVQPIESMLELLKNYPPTPPPPRPLSQSPDGSKDRAWKIAVSDGRLQPAQVDSLMKPLPTPLMASGLSPEVLRAFQPEFDSLGLNLLQAPVGQSSAKTEYRLEPGSPVAAVLMSGDFKVAALGTTTYRDGDTVLAFGHQFFKFGQVAIPMAGAEVITVVRSLQLSSKLGSIGPVIGGIYQDRITGVAGKIGAIPPMTKISIKTKSAAGLRHVYQGEMMEHPRLSPLMSGLALLQALAVTLETGEEQTFFINGEITFEGYEPVKIRDTAAGPMIPLDIARQFYAEMLELMDNPFEKARVSAVNFEIEMQDRWLHSRIKEVRMENPRVQAGGSMELVLVMQNYQSEPVVKRVSIPVPAGAARGDEFTVLVADAAEAERADRLADAPAVKLSDRLDQWRRQRSRQAVYIKLMKKAAGLQVEGASMFDLPPSVLAQYASPANNSIRRSLEETTLWETSLPVPGVFAGSARLPVKIE